MKEKLPTVKELVQIFEDRNWGPAFDTDYAGAEREAVNVGKCCIIPALLVYEGKFDEVYDNPDFEDGMPYAVLKEKYGDHIWCGFDGQPAYSSKNAVYQLGRDLREAFKNR